jgi:hypothetical protein
MLVILINMHIKFVGKVQNVLLSYFLCHQSNCLSKLINDTEPYDLLQINIDGIWSQTQREIDFLKEQAMKNPPNKKIESSRAFILNPSNSSLWETFLNFTFGNAVLTQLREETVFSVCYAQFSRVTQQEHVEEEPEGELDMYEMLFPEPGQDPSFIFSFEKGFIYLPKHLR